MTDAECREICTSRMREWAETSGNAHTTPLLCVAVGHDHEEGRIVVMVPDGVALEMVDIILRAAVKQLGKRDLEVRHVDRQKVIDVD